LPNGNNSECRHKFPSNESTFADRVSLNAGGGYKGFCDYEEIKAAIHECDGLDGARLEACYAEFGCDVDRVTEHYAKAAGIEKKTDKK
jgi:hypothetical protein